VFNVIDRVYVMKFEVCQHCFMLLSRVHVMITEITLDIPQTSLHKHGTAQKLLTHLELHYINTGQ
jgi:hypothetical protein